jgi:hypothetical protein
MKLKPALLRQWVAYAHVSTHMPELRGSGAPISHMTRVFCARARVRLHPLRPEGAWLDGTTLRSIPLLAWLCGTTPARHRHRSYTCGPPVRVNACVCKIIMQYTCVYAGV